MLNYVDKIYTKKGFNFDNTLRNSFLTSPSDMQKHFHKTGTTIVGIICKDGVIIAADTRSTADHIAEKNTQKIHIITENIVACGAGTAADNDYFAKKLTSELELMERNTGR